MNLRHYEALHWIARLGGFHAAARRLGLSQAAISARVRELEAALGQPVFERAGRGVRLTAAGHALAPYAAQFVTLEEEVQRRIGGADGLRGRVRLGATNIHALTWLPALLDRVARSHPGLVVEVAVDSSETLRGALERGGLDLAVVAGPLDPARVRGEPVGDVAHVWVASPALALPARPLDGADLAAHPVISDRPGTLLHAAMTEWFRAEGAAPARNHSASNLQTRLHLARAGLGIALVARSAVARDLVRGTLVLAETRRAAPSLSYFLARAAAEPGPVVGAVLDAARALLRQKADLDALYAAAHEASEES